MPTSRHNASTISAGLSSDIATKPNPKTKEEPLMQLIFKYIILVSILGLVAGWIFQLDNAQQLPAIN